MTALNITPSADGVARFAVRIEHRVGAFDLVAGLLYGLQLGFGNLTEKGPMGPAIEQVRRQQVIDWTRRALHEFGETGLASAGASVCAECRTEAERRIERLFPEFKKHNQKGGRNG